MSAAGRTRMRRATRMAPIIIKICAKISIQCSNLNIQRNQYPNSNIRYRILNQSIKLGNQSVIVDLLILLKHKQNMIRTKTNIMAPNDKISRVSVDIIQYFIYFTLIFKIRFNPGPRSTTQGLQILCIYPTSKSIFQKRGFLILLNFFL